MFDSPLTLTGVIATLLSVIFAVAAWMNTRRRRQAMAQQTASSVDVESRHGSSQIDFQGSPANKQALFKKVGPNGQPAEPLQPTSDHNYAWE